jgi:uncharacterized protein (UPF0264 family)
VPADDPSLSLISHPPRRSLVGRRKLLVSVRGPDEVEAAITGGADWIDLKEPRAGALGAVKAEVAKRVVDCIGDRVPISAALGELLAWDESSAGELLGVPNIKVVKVGLAGCGRVDNWQDRWQSVAKSIVKAGHELAVVAYADWQQAAAPAPAEVIATAKAVRSRFFLLDTYDKKSGSLLNHLSASELDKTLRLARDFSLTTVIAGSLRQDDLAALASTETDIIGVRGSVCGGDRTARIDPQLVADFRAALNRIDLKTASTVSYFAPSKSAKT